MLLLLLPAVLAAPLSVAGIPSPRPRDSWVADVAEVLTPAQEAAIDQRVEALQAELGAEIAVVTVDEIDDQPKAFATALFNRWGIGDESANNGVLVLLVVGARRVEVETGYGVEGILTDGWLGRMMDDSMVPAFKAGELGAGLVAGVEAIDGRLRRYPEETRLGTGGAVSGPALEDAVRGTNPAVLALAVGGGLGVPALIGGSVLLRRRRRQCPVCRQPMAQLSEEADDAHLDAGQRKEEALGSIDYDVLVCDQHQQVRVLPRGKWFSGYVRCPGCGYKTGTSRTNTLVSATYTSGGRVEVVENCDHCGRRRRSTHSTPKLTPPSSSSSSSGGFSGGGGGGGGSFGGGSSGGGGAGRSW